MPSTRNKKTRRRFFSSLQLNPVDPFSTLNDDRLGLNAFNLDEYDSYQKQDDDKAPSTALAKFYFGARRLLAVIGGFIDGVITAPLKGIASLVNQGKNFTPQTPAKTIALIPWKILKKMALHPIKSAKNWLAFEEKQQRRLRKRKNSSETKGSKNGYLRLGFYGVTGFIVGCIKAPFAGIEACFKIPPQETFSASILKAPFRFIYALFVSPLQTAKNWAFNIVEKRKNEEPDYLTKENKSHYKIKNFIGYIRLSFNAVSGFILGCIKAPFAAINAVLHSPDESIFYSFIMAVPRFLNTLFTIPFSTADEWLENSKNLLDEEIEKEKIMYSFSESTRNSKNNVRPISVMDYVRIGLTMAIGFIVGCIVAPIFAIDELILKRKPSNTEFLLESLILTPFRFLHLLMRIPFLIADESGKTEKALIETAEEAPPRVAISGLSNYARAFFKGFFGFIVGLITAPIKGIINCFTVPPSTEEVSLLTLVKLPVHYLETLLFFPFMLAYNWAKPLVQKKDKSSADESNSKGNNNQQIHQKFGSNDPQYNPSGKPPKTHHQHQKQAFHFNHFSLPKNGASSAPPAASPPASQSQQNSFS